MNIVAIGGGEMGRPGTRVETLRIDKEILALCGKKSPRLLFVPTASHDSQEYIEIVKRHFGKRLGCRVDTLLLYGKKLAKSEIEKKIMAADIIYVGGGNTLSMLRMWRKLGVDTVLAKAAAKGKVLAGLSAGAVCWFRYANSDSRKMVDPSADYIRVRCLNFMPLFLVPHFDAEKGRQASLKRMLKGTRQTAIGLDNCSALMITGDNYRIVTSSPTAAAHLCYWKEGNYFSKKIQPNQKFSLADFNKAA